MPSRARGALTSKGAGSDWKGDIQRHWAQVAVVGEDRYDSVKDFADAHGIPETIACRVILNAGIDCLSRIRQLRAKTEELLADRRVYNR